VEDLLDLPKLQDGMFASNKIAVGDGLEHLRIGT
jgi:hypothetical protein